MRRMFFLFTATLTAVVAALHVLGYVWHRPPALLYYMILIINYAPKWVWLLSSAAALVLSLRSGVATKLWVGLLFITVLWMQDIQVKAWLVAPEPASPSLTVMTLNTGGTSAERVSQLVKSHKPDIIMLQESQQKRIETMVGEAWNTHCAGHICMASRYAFDVVDAFNRATFSDWGSFAAAYDVRIGEQTVRVVNAHLETPRDALGGRPLIDFSKQATDEYAYEKHTELRILSTLLAGANPALIGGDLNTGVLEAAYREHLGMYTNAVSEAATGINYTKYTRWHGVRIDHVVTNNKVKVHDARVLRDTGGDHRAVLVAFSVIGQ